MWLSKTWMFLFLKNNLPTMSKKRCRYHYNQYTKIYFMVVIIATILLYTIYNSDENDSNFVKKGQLTSVIKQELTYLLNTSTCKIPESNPYSEDIVSFIKEEKYFKCSSKDLLTYISKNDGIVTLNVNRSLLSEYSTLKINCCYSNITRVNYEKLDDNKINLTDCNYFEDSVGLEFPYVRVICSTIFTVVYDNVHATTLPLKEEKRTLSTNSEFSVLLLGIDSMSKANLKRTMPETYRYAEKNMINLKGYNKIGDNTFPNLMAILTGYSLDQLAISCNRTIKLNYCNFIWDSFKEAKYITAFAEDECIISTYHFDRPGFLNEPTDFYYHPYFLAAEQLSVIKRKDMTYCAGPETSGERVLNAAKDFSVTFNDSLSFGLFWSNSFSHDDVNMPAVMDKPIYKLLSDPEFLASLNHTILLFFSDHGFRFGDIRYTHTGWLEERLPFMYLRLPDYFKYAFPEKYNNLLINSERLTTPWDVFNTFQDILKLQNDSYSIFASPGCPTCQSLFTEIAEDRTCGDANIKDHWCTCNGHSYINPEHPKVKSICRFVVSEINRYIQSFEDGALCMKYTIKRIKTSGVSETYVNNKNETFRNYLVMVETVPPAIFEATVEEVLDDYNLKLLAEPSRVDRYEPVTKCIKNNGSLKKFCYCDSLSARIKRIFS